MTEMVDSHCSELRAVMTLDAPLPFVTRRASDILQQYYQKKVKCMIPFSLPELMLIYCINESIPLENASHPVLKRLGQPAPVAPILKVAPHLDQLHHYLTSISKERKV